MEKKQRPSTEKKINNEKFRLKLGTINKKNPEVIYLEGKTFVTPLNVDDNYTALLHKTKREFNFAINETLKSCNLFERKFILDFQIANNGVMMNKKSFLTFQLLLRQNRLSVKQFKDIKNKSNSIIESLTKTLITLLEQNNFIVSKSKKEAVFSEVY